MIKKRNRHSLILRIYFTLFVFLVSFFTLYAFRYDVLEMFTKKQYDYFKISAEAESKLKQQLREVEVNTESIDQVKAIMKPFTDTYSYAIYTTVLVDDVESTREEEVSYFYIAEGYAPTKHTTKYVQTLEGDFKNVKYFLSLYPKMNPYLLGYSLCAFVLAFIVSLLLFYGFTKEAKSHKVSRQLRRIYMRLPFQRGKTISFQLVMVIVSVGFMAALSFLYMYDNRYAFFDFMKESTISSSNFDNYVQTLKNYLQYVPLNKQNLTKVMEKLSVDLPDSSEVYLYSNTGMYYAGSPNERLTTYFVRNSIFNISSVYTPIFHQYAIPVSGQVASITIYEYPLVNLVTPYVIVITLLSLSLFLIPLLLFIRYKVNHIKKIQEDIEILASGDWEHDVVRDGDDEIGELEDHLNQMRLSFVDNMQKEKQAIQANKELIASLSHDIRTPLTALQGYLEIINLKKYKDQKQYETYLKNCIEKVQQINELSNKTFEYALVFEVEDEFEKTLVDMHEVCEYVRSTMEYLRLQGFQVKSTVDVRAEKMYLNVTFWKRIINNLCSNVSKYADPCLDTIITLTQEKNALKLSVVNGKKQDDNVVESNRIGLKSVKRMVQLLHGDMYINDQDDCFIVVISLPINE